MDYRNSLRRTAGALLITFTPFGAVVADATAAPAPTPPRLVLQLTVDQLRGDLLQRYRKSFGRAGFRLLMDRGLNYANAHYETANTITCAGHAVLVTGADVAEHGIVGNEWFDRDAGKKVYCVDDARYPAVGEPAPPGTGMSPANLTSTTLGDELVSASGNRSRAFAISGKDRSAIVPGGHLGKAYWFSGSTGGVATSKYYYDALPAWVAAWNGKRLYDNYRERGWTLLRAPESYVYASRAANPFAHPKATIGRAFPHALNVPDADLIKSLRFTPFLDELTADFARELVTQEKLGTRGATDYLSISFSSTDYVGHSYGPNSVESEDNLLHLDATLTKLFAFIDRTVGLRNTVIVLSADHGVDDVPEERASEGYDAARVGGEKLRARLNAALASRFGSTDGLVVAIIPPGFYLDRAKIEARKLDAAAVESALAEELLRGPGFAYAFTRTDLLAGRIGNTPLLDSVQRAFHPKRSGDVVVVQKQFWYFDDDPDYYASMHGSPYSYDTYVPILLLVPGVKAETIHSETAPAQIAPTLAAILGIKPPSGCACDPVLPGVFSR
ncbi:MAG: alkaline phosphatase family protein [Gammaproteobacteria bacterium]